MQLDIIRDLKLTANEGRNQMLEAIRSMREQHVMEAMRLLDVEASLRQMTDPALGLPMLKAPDDEDVEKLRKALDNLGKASRGDSAERFAPDMEKAA